MASIRLFCSPCPVFSGDFYFKIEDILQLAITLLIICGQDSCPARPAVIPPLVSRVINISMHTMK
jgi:hypothetical protein